MNNKIEYARTVGDKSWHIRRARSFEREMSCGLSLRPGNLEVRTSIDSVPEDPVVDICKGCLEKHSRHLSSIENKQTALETQHGGDHYKKLKIQPVEYAVANQMGPLEFSVLKYITRHGDKDKEKDLKKALHFCQLALKLLYGIESKVEYIEPEKAKL